MSEISYAERRRGRRYYKYIKSLLSFACTNAESIIDVGSNGVDLLSVCPCKYKVSLDVENPLVKDGVISIREDFLDWKPTRQLFDVVTCFQVLEHIDDDKIMAFVGKLKKLGKVLMVSVPYRWPHGKCEDHVQDPIDIDKLEKWFGQRPVFANVVVDDSAARLIAIYVNAELTSLVESSNNGNFVDFFRFDYEYEANCAERT